MMKKKLIALFLCVVLCIGTLTACDSQEDYQNDCALIEKTLKQLLDMKDKRDSKKDYDKIIKKVADILESTSPDSSEGNDLKEEVLGFWETYGKDATYKSIPKGERKKVQQSINSVIAAWDAFIDAAQDKGADVDDLLDFEKEIISEYR